MSAAAKVQVIPVARRELVITREARGQVMASRSQDMIALVSGRIVSLTVHEGGRLQAGQLLAQIDTTEYALAVADAGARVRASAAAFDEMTMFDERIADSAVRSMRVTVARAKTGLESAEVLLARARLDLERSTMRAPFEGQVASLRRREGDWVRAGEVIATLVVTSPLDVRVQVLEGDLPKVRVGYAAEVLLTADSGRRYSAHVMSVSPVVDTATRTGSVTLRLEVGADAVRPGMFAIARIAVDRLQNRLVVPTRAVVARDGRRFVFVYEGAPTAGRALWRYVEIRASSDSLVEIAAADSDAPVAAGDLVLVGGHERLVHGAPIRRDRAIGADASGSRAHATAGEGPDAQR